MYLQKLEIFGFKSFAHKLTLDFGPGITGVVGPNGCGKTNVADAIRWVLGEQSASELRGSSMADVIFNGTKSRRRLGMAEVTLTIDNTSGFLPTDFSEVVIGRRVFRSGESEYLVNKNTCRLRDVRDLFIDTGIGTRTYSLIERKMVDSVLSDSAGHRRFMFEEAAGIMRYKVRKRSALSKLSATEADMQRVSDIISEVEKQVRSLKRQLAQARRHRRYVDELRDLEIALGRRDYAACVSQRAECTARSSGHRQSLAASEEILRKGEGIALGARRELRDKEEALTSLELEVSELEGRARQLADGVLVGRERRAASDRRAQELDAELADIQMDLALAVKTATGLEDEIQRTTSVSQERDGELSITSETLAEVERRYRGLKETLDKQRQTRLEELESSAGLKGELETYRGRLDDLMTEHVEIEESLGERRSALADKEMDILKALEAERDLMDAARQGGVSSKEAGRALDAAREHLLSSRERAARLEGELATARRRLDLLAEIRDGYGGFPDGVRALLSEGSHGIDGLLGTVADIVDVEPAMTDAVEAALEGEAQYVVTRDVKAARAAVRHLTAQSLGKATFIPLSELATIDARSIDTRVASHAGVIGPAASFVHCDPEFTPLVSFLLEDVVIVESLDVALALGGMPEASGLAFTTPGGDMITRAGLLSGGRRGTDDAGFLRRSERVESANREIKALESRLAEARTEQGSAQSALNEGAEHAAGVEEQALKAEAELWEAKRRVTELELAKTNLSESVSQLVSRRDALGLRMDETRRDTEALAGRLAGVSKGEDELGERVGELDREFKSAELALSKATEERKQAEIGAAAARSALTQLKTEQAQLSEAATAARASIQKKNAERAEHLRVVAELDESTAKDTQALNKLRDEKAALEADRDSMRESARVLRDRSEQLEDEARSTRTHKDEVRTELHELELRDTELKGRSEALRDRLREEYSVDIAELGDVQVQEGEEPFDEPKVREEVDRLKARLRSMGPVNLLALDEYDEESQRLEFLKGQYEDLEKSKESLKIAIDRINSAATSMFLDTFSEVRQNFIDTFQRLFEGGEADLRLEDPADPLESSIEIMASPRGKRLGRLSLLSGGERALTAIALLFAIYLVKPSPFCILDEVDAPLDDANVNRFIHMLREFSARTQFVIITHNKTTMQSADRLYGITMEESGVSKVVSVRLDEALDEVEREEALHEAA